MKVSLDFTRPTVPNARGADSERIDLFGLELGEARRHKRRKV
jgi:hypothetical protein